MEPAEVLVLVVAVGVVVALLVVGARPRSRRPGRQGAAGRRRSADGGAWADNGGSGAYVGGFDGGGSCDSGGDGGGDGGGSCDSGGGGGGD